MFRTEKLDNSELGACHHSYVLAICRNPGISGEELAELICVNKSNVARNLSYLEEHGYVRREQAKDDKRVTLCCPTDKMLEILPKVKEAIAQWNRSLTNDLTDEEVAVFTAVLDKMAKKAREMVSKSGCSERK